MEVRDQSFQEKFHPCIGIVRVDGNRVLGDGIGVQIFQFRYLDLLWIHLDV